MAKRDPIGPQRQLVHQRIRDIVGSVYTDDSGEEGPGAKGPRRERVHGTGGGGVDAGIISHSEIALKTIGSGNDGDLRWY